MPNTSAKRSKKSQESAKKWIEEIALFEAKSLSKQTAMTIKEIVYWLGYDDPSYFNKNFSGECWSYTFGISEKIKPKYFISKKIGLDIKASVNNFSCFY